MDNLSAVKFAELLVLSTTFAGDLVLPSRALLPSLCDISFVSLVLSSDVLSEALDRSLSLPLAIFGSSFSVDTHICIGESADSLTSDVGARKPELETVGCRGVGEHSCITLSRYTVPSGGT